MVDMGAVTPQAIETVEQLKILNGSTDKLERSTNTLLIWTKAMASLTVVLIALTIVHLWKLF